MKNDSLTIISICAIVTCGLFLLLALWSHFYPKGYNSEKYCKAIAKEFASSCSYSTLLLKRDGIINDDTFIKAIVSCDKYQVEEFNNCMKR